MKQLSQYLIETLDGDSKVFVILKPGSLDLGQTIIGRFAEDGWIVDRTITKKLLLSEAEELYKVHKKKDFYKSLCEYMSSDPCRAFIFKKSKSSDPFEEVKKIKGEIREKYGESDMRNVLHSSDSEEAMTNEAQIFFQVW